MSLAFLGSFFTGKLGLKVCKCLFCSFAFFGGGRFAYIIFQALKFFSVFSFFRRFLLRLGLFVESVYFVLDCLDSIVLFLIDKLFSVFAVDTVSRLY